jgi:hypothetical protein
VTFADPSGAEYRLFIDTVFSVRPDLEEVGDDELRRLRALAQLHMGTVSAAATSDGGALTLDFGCARLEVSGTAAAFTTHDVWWLASTSA